MSVNNGCDTCYDYKLIDIADIYLKRKCNGDIIRKIRMGIYDVYVFCDECNDSHDMSFCISLDDGPAEKESIENLYAGKELPSYFATLLNNKVQCPNTRRMFLQEDNNQIFLVPVSG